MGPDEVAREIEIFDGDIIQMAWHNQRLAVSVKGHENCFLYSTQVNQAGLMDIELVGRDAIMNLTFDANWHLIKQCKQNLINQSNAKEYSKRINHTYKVDDLVLVKNEPVI